MTTTPTTTAAAPRWREVWADLGPLQAAHGVIGFVFAATAPVAIILAVGTRGGLDAAALASWIFGVFFVNGLLTLALSWRWRQPLAFFWTIPGTVLVGPALQHLSLAEVVGAYWATAALMLLAGLAAWPRRVLQALPMPIVMGMVAGVFLRFGLDLVRALHTDLAIAGPMVGAWLLLSALPAWGRRLPPLIGALAVGAVVLVLLGRVDGTALGALQLVRPVPVMPQWSWAAMVELVGPLAITVLVVQNGQGFAVLQAAGHQPPVGTVTRACALGSAASACVGAVSSCLAGPTNAILVASGPRERQYAAALVTGALAVAFGLVAPAFTRLLLALPAPFVMALAGLAMLKVLQGAFAGAFGGRHALGALVAFLVTVADQPLWHIGAAFWGLVAGWALSALLERADFAASAASSSRQPQ